MLRRGARPRQPQFARGLRHAALPDRLRDRRGPRHGHRHRSGLGNWPTVAISVALAFFFGYLLTSLPLLRAGLALAVVVPIALASDTLSITVMEIVDNAIMLLVPGAMEAGLDSLLFWGSLAFALAVAGVVAVPVNRWLIARGKGHAVVHETGIHGGPPIPVAGAIAALAFVFGSSCSAPRRSASPSEPAAVVACGRSGRGSRRGRESAGRAGARAAWRARRAPRAARGACPRTRAGHPRTRGGGRR